MEEQNNRFMSFWKCENRIFVTYLPISELRAVAYDEYGLVRFRSCFLQLEDDLEKYLRFHLYVVDIIIYQSIEFDWYVLDQFIE